MTGRTEDGATMRPTEGETPVDDAEVAKLSAEFGLAGCSGVTRLRDTRTDEFIAQSWRVRDSDRCNSGWVDRQGRYSILKFLDVSQAERNRLPWLCSEDGAHISECVSQGAEPTLLMRQPRDADYIVFHRITKIAK